MDRLNKIIRFFKTKKGKSISFFAFYIVFFIFLGFYINNQDIPKEEEKPKEEVLEKSDNYYETNNLENSDYLYKITIQNNSELEILNGSKSNNESIKNYKYYEFVDLNEIKRIIKNAKYLSKSLYSSDTYKVNYEIKTKDLFKLFNTENDLDSINNIVLTVKENSDLEKIELDFSNYMNSLDESISLYKVLIEYEY